MRVGYIRVSTLDQNTVRQLDGIAVERTFTDKASGKDTARPQLEELIGFVREGDTVLVHSMDRLARNLDDLRRIVRTLTGKGVRVEFVKEALTFTGEDSPMANLLLSVMGAFAEFERALILERQREGIAAAKARGVYTGRKRALTDAQAHQLRQRAAAGEKKAALAREFGISRETVYTYLETLPDLPADRRPTPSVTAYDQLLTHPPTPTGEASPDPEPRERPRPSHSDVSIPGPDARWAARVTRWATSTVPVRELVGLARDPGTGGWKVTDRDDGVYLGALVNEPRLGSTRARWTARDRTGARLTVGPWKNRDEAVIGLLGRYIDMQARGGGHLGRRARRNAGR